MEIIFSIAVGLFFGSGIWMTLRARLFPVLLGLSLISYSVNLFIFATGRLSMNQEPIIRAGIPANVEYYADPLPQSLVLTAIVISFAMLALLLVVAMVSRGLTHTDNVDGNGE